MNTAPQWPTYPQAGAQMYMRVTDTAVEWVISFPKEGMTLPIVPAPHAAPAPPRAPSPPQHLAPVPTNPGQPTTSIPFPETVVEPPIRLETVQEPAPEIPFGAPSPGAFATAHPEAQTKEFKVPTDSVEPTGFPHYRERYDTQRVLKNFRKQQAEEWAKAALVIALVGVLGALMVWG